MVTGDTVNALSENIMYVFQDKKGNHWFGSWLSGVYRYDGKNLIHFTTEHGLASNRIDEIKEDEFGNIYFNSCHSTSTITKFNGLTLTILTPIAGQEWKTQPNDIWFMGSYDSEKVYRFDGTILYELDIPKPPGFSNHFEIYSIYKDHKDNIWFGTNPLGVCRFNGTSFNWITEEDVTEFRNEGANGVRSIVQDVNGDFWFNTEFRYSIYDSATINSNTFYTRKKSIGSLDGKEDSDLDEYLSITKDNSNNLWMATYKDGVWKYDGKNITHYSIQENEKKILLFSIYKDYQGIIWLGTHENGVWKLEDDVFKRILE